MNNIEVITEKGTRIIKTKSTHFAVETAINLSKGSRTGTWEQSALEYRDVIATYDEICRYD